MSKSVKLRVPFAFDDEKSKNPLQGLGFCLEMLL